MKKLLTMAAAMFLAGSLFAGGLVTNTNQSAAWVRLPARDASTSIDATYFNPAGLMKLNNGLHFSISNQSIFQTREVDNDYPYLNDSYYKGEVTALLFPTVYAVYKMDKLAFSFGFNPVGGGGGATYDRGLPSFEMSPSDLVPALANASDYRLDAFFEGTSVFFGYQAGISYKINDVISVFAGVRYVTAKNTYNGYLRGIELNYGGTWTPATLIFNGIAQQATGAATSMQPLIDAGIGGLTFAQAEGATAINATQRAQLEGGLLSFGVPQATINAMTLQQAQGAYASAAQQYTASSALLADKEADVEQTASGITPIIGVNISPSENFNIGLKYEFATELEFTNATTADILTGFTETGAEITMFPDKAKFRGDMPAMLSAGIDYTIGDALRLSVGTHYYFDKPADYGKKINGEYVSNEEVIDNNYLEVVGGLEYNLSKKLLVSAGYLYAKTGVNENYQSDLSYSLTSSTIGVGGAYKFNEKIMLNLGFGYTMYNEGSKTIDHEFVTGAIIPAIETYGKSNSFIAIGLDISL
ncbi:MAG: outer membrane protein transport protein [Bacteroidales bacterium]|nr:outer membrane protein transport protein [Bacteroidales bacterium]